MTGIDIERILKLAPSPACVVDLGRLRNNLAVPAHPASFPFEPRMDTNQHEWSLGERF